MTDTRAETGNAEAKAAHAPLPLPAGSFYLSDLEKVAAAAGDAKPEERDAIIAEGLAQANRRPDKPDEFTILPGHSLKTVERTLVEGVERPVPGKEGETETVGAVTVTETIQVFQEERGEEEIAAAGGDTFDAATFVGRNLDEITDGELKALAPSQLAAVREAEVGGRNRTTLINRIDAVAGERESGV